MISIVIPAYNEEKYLARCLKSLKEQDYSREYEIIVVDNGSTDKTAVIAKNFGVFVIPCFDKRGVFHARKVGANAACGEIIAQADADTIYPRDWLRRIVDQFVSHPEAVAVAGRFFYSEPPAWSKIEYVLRDFVNKLTVALFGRPWLVSGATFAFRRNSFLKANGYHGLSFSADQYGIASRLRKLGRVLYDRDLHVWTSSRAVEKPFFFIFVDVLVHLNRWVTYIVRYYAAIAQGYISETRIRRIAAGTLPLGILVIFSAYGYFVPASPVFGKVYSEIRSPEKLVALTFDDGPNEPYTSEVLDILASYNVKATFFVIGKNVELYPETARRIVTEGHVLANHSYSHDANHALTDYGSKDLKLAQTTISSIVGVSPHLYRPPHGKKSPWELETVKEEGLIEVTWSVSTGELNTKSAALVAERIVRKTRPGEIILLHDGYGTDHNCAKSDKSLTVQALPLIIQRLQAEGFEFVTVPVLLNVPAYNN
jgi:peptidoglycan/xylan/chitin deacetylase (PgdA/CDA1 family)